MNYQLNAIVVISIVGLVLVAAHWSHKAREWKPFGLGLAALTAFVIFLNRLFGFPFAGMIVAKGPDGALLLPVALYICVLTGMFGQYLYRHFERPKRIRRKWDWGLFVAPVFASPIILMPLLAAFQDAEIDLIRLTVPRLMIFCVAFQNGFFWKEFFDHQQERARVAGD